MISDTTKGMHIITILRSILVKERKARHLRQNEVAYATGVSTSSLSKWEKGGYSDDITLLHFIRWCEAVGVKPGEVIDNILARVDTRMEMQQILSKAI